MRSSAQLTNLQSSLETGAISSTIESNSGHKPRRQDLKCAAMQATTQFMRMELTRSQEIYSSTATLLAQSRRSKTTMTRSVYSPNESLNRNINFQKIEKPRCCSSIVWSFGQAPRRHSSAWLMGLQERRAYKGDNHCADDGCVFFVWIFKIVKRGRLHARFRFSSIVYLLAEATERIALGSLARSNLESFVASI